MKEHNVKTLLDIGANIGQYAADIKKHHPDIFILSIEPNSKCEPYLQQVGVRYLICCPSIERGVKSFYKKKSESIGTGHSLYRENSYHHADDAVEIEQVQTDTLDSILEENGLSHIQFDMIKLDTQGSELDILKGATRTLKSAKLVVAETDVGNYNLGCPTQTEVISFMEQNGFSNLGSLYDHWQREVSKPYLAQQDLLFERVHTWLD